MLSLLCETFTYRARALCLQRAAPMRSRGRTAGRWGRTGFRGVALFLWDVFPKLTLPFTPCPAASHSSFLWFVWKRAFVRGLGVSSLVSPLLNTRPCGLHSRNGFSAVQEAGSPRSRCWQVQCPPRLHAASLRGRPLCVQPWCPLCVLTSSSYKDSSQIRQEPTRMASF